MTQKEKKQELRKAAAKIARGDASYSCVAIVLLMPWDKKPSLRALRKEYAEFYEFNTSEPADFSGDISRRITDEAQLARSLALLLYAETL